MFLFFNKSNMFFRFTPSFIIKQRQRQLVSTVLMTILIIASSYYLFTFSTATATNTYTWNDTVTLDKPAQTDTTRNDFLSGYALSERYNSVAVTEVDDGEVTLNKDWSYNYNISTDPAIANDYVYQTFLDTNNNLLYVSTNGNGLSVISFQLPADPGDDTLLFNYNSISTPSLNSEYIYNTFVNNGQLYVSTDNGLSVINMQGSTDPSDDTLDIRYHTGSVPALASNSVFHLFIGENSLYYISTANGLSVINMQGTIDPSDDTFVTNYNTGSTPALATDAVVHTFMNNNLLYISTSESGLYVINTQGTTDPGDDVLVTRYYTGSSPALANDYVYHAFLHNNLLYISTYGGGLSVINTQGTTDPGDDVLVVNYDTDSSPALEGSGGETFHSFMSNDLLYISTNGGLFIIDTQGTTDPGDDVLVTRYYTGSSPALATNSVFNSFLENDRLYVSTASGVSVINVSEEYNASATYLSLPRPLAITPTTSLSVDFEGGDGQDHSLSYRTGTSDAVWRDDFDTTDSYDPDGIGGDGDVLFDTFTAENGILTLSGAPESNYYTNIYIDTGMPADYFPTGSIVKAKVRANVSDTEREFIGSMYGGGGTVEFTDTNEWIIITSIVESDFSIVSFYNYFSDNLDYDLAGTFEIDWIQITTPDSMGEWNAWSTDCADAVCSIDPEDLSGNSWIQYRLDLATDNLLLTPKVFSVTYQGDYVTSDTYTSTTETFDSTQSLLNFDVTADMPTDTTITYEYSTDNASNWIPVTPGASINQTADNFTWRATLTTTDSALTPTITEVTLSTTDLVSSADGSGGGESTSINKRIASLEAEGKLTEAEALRQQNPHLFMTRTTQDIQREIIIKAREVIVLLEMIIRLRGDQCKKKKPR